ncbi:MAG: hypothetical protein A3F84_22090 [Candidatus Handelsmanbacteria bacterium RIFCSPLOWO2_12_FULL_64_10]|uniref:Flagellar motor switch protein FliG C-terminal domain-containing protein n=1 Tax=Handelsmanbacteria sp. (strain RIFCSPLOWO2_12_FULL_64_10) TaxID=1817868 RepID=A0A1F6D0N4_HANXR|nr:MAG: hypothetical protein A3F84_22090 [Candidatus Handelsmanbacteria bacterium RIFCSPLOWO2_12_FULL_64_10]
MSFSFDDILPPLTAALAPMGQKAREVLISCLPDPLARAVNARLRRGEGQGEDETPLGRELRAQAEEAWGGEEEKAEGSPSIRPSGATRDERVAVSPSSGQGPRIEGRLRIEGQKAEGKLDLADVLALILRRARPAVLTRGLLQLPRDLAAEVLYRVAAVNLSQVQHRVEEEEAGVFFWQLREALGDARLKPAPELAARALRPIAAHTVRQLLTGVHRIDPGAMKAVQDLAYPFEDLAHLSDPELQMVLMGVENRDIALALQTTPAVAQDRIEQGMSARRRQAVDEEATLAGEVSEEAARKAQSRIVDRARLLYEQGQLHTYFGSIEDTGAREQDLREARQALYEKHAAWVAQWIRQSGRGARQSVGVALAALAFVVGGWLFLKYLMAASRAVRPAQETRVERQRGGEGGSGEAGKKRMGERERGRGGEKFPPLSPFPPFSHSGRVEGLRVSFPPGEEVSGEGLQPGSGRGEVRLRAGTLRVVALDSTAALETPLVRVTGEAGAAYRVRVGLDATTRLTALRGTLLALPADGKGGGTRIEEGLEAVFSPGGAVQVLTASPDVKDLAWLEENR